MEEDSVVALPRPGANVESDPLLAVLREGARRMLMQAIEAEVETFLTAHAGLVDDQGRRRVVRNGHAPERQLQTGIGPVEVRRPKVRDRGAAADGEPIRFLLAFDLESGIPEPGEISRVSLNARLEDGSVLPIP